VHELCRSSDAEEHDVECLLANCFPVAYPLWDEQVEQRVQVYMLMVITNILDVDGDDKHPGCYW
jgi:hypothetical protein